jgi:hypothetical protein
LGLRPTDTGPACGWARLDLEAIAQAIGAYPAPPGPAGDEVRRFLEGYRYVDALLAEAIEIFDYGRSRHLLELNHRVLCGVTPERRQQFAAHIRATEERFYDGGEDAGYGALHAWYRRNRTRPAGALAAGAFVGIASTPQLFVEGNQRTALLVASYLLARGGLPPAVVPAEDWQGFEAVSDRVVAIDRCRLGAGIALAFAAQRVGAFLDTASDPRFLRAAAPAEAGRQG